MKYTFRTFFCGAGDCIFLMLEEGDNILKNKINKYFKIFLENRYFRAIR